MSLLEVSIGEDVAAYDELLDALVRDRVASRIFEKDATLWGDAAEDEARIRLGWTTFAEAAAEIIPDIEDVRAEFASAGVDRIVLCGMGGSSLAPAVIARWAGVELTMIDSTHPAVIERVLGGDLARTAVVVSSKSGSTIETRSHLAAFEQAFRDAGIDSRVVIVTDPGSPLDEESRAAGRLVFNADPNVGGRFSALTAFGLVPSGLAEVDLKQFVSDAESARGQLAVDSPDNPALRLAAAIAAGLPERFVLTTWSPSDVDWGLGSWIEQLVAESTGKEGKGVLPIALATSAPEFREEPKNTLSVGVTGEEAPEDLSAFTGIVTAGTLGGQMLLWEVATAALGRLMGIDPFNQPDVESAKIAARAALAAAASAGDDAASSEAATPPSPAETVAWLRDNVEADGYLVIQAYLDAEADYAEGLSQLRDRLAASLGVPVALGWGPSYLHSTGQLHKGGPTLGAFLQLTDGGMSPLPIPGNESGFETLIAAQARGDRDVLEERGRPVLTLEAADPAAAIAELLEAL